MYVSRPTLMAALLGCCSLLTTGTTPATPSSTSMRCTCMSPKRPVCEVWWQTSAIFVARAIRIRTLTEHTSEGKRVSKLVTLRVSERFQGIPGEREVEVGTGAGGGDCGFDFHRGETYLVYAGRSTATGRLETGICSRTARLEDAGEDLAYLRAIPEAEPIVSLYGMIYRERQRLEPGKHSDRPLDPGGPMPGVHITLSELPAATGSGSGADNASLTLETTSDSEGWYEFADLHPGRYEIRLQGKNIGEHDRWRFRIPIAPACIWRNIIVDPLPLQ